MANDFTGEGVLTLSLAGECLSIGVAHERLSNPNEVEEDSQQYLDWLVGIQLMRIMHLLTQPSEKNIEVKLSLLADSSVQFSIGEYRLIKSSGLGYRLESSDNELLEKLFSAYKKGKFSYKVETGSEKFETFFTKLSSAVDYKDQIERRIDLQDGYAQCSDKNYNRKTDALLLSALGNDDDALKKIKNKMTVLQKTEKQLDSFFAMRAKTLAPQVENHYKKKDWKIIGRYYQYRGDRLKKHLEALRVLQFELKKNHFDCDTTLRVAVKLDTKALYDETFIPFIKTKKTLRKIQKQSSKVSRLLSEQDTVSLFQPAGEKRSLSRKRPASFMEQESKKTRAL